MDESEGKEERKEQVRGGDRQRQEGRNQQLSKVMVVFSYNAPEEIHFFNYRKIKSRTSAVERTNFQEHIMH